MQVPTTFAIAAAIACAAFAPQPLRAQAPEAKTADQVYKNIVELKGTPADQLLPAMQFIAVSLGVDCNFCHVQGKNELDDKPAKRTARSMMAMTAAINKDHFHGQRQITCYSCHHGSSHPAGIPPVLESDAAPRPETRTVPPAGAAVTADDIVAKYVAALGGADAIRKIASRVQTGTLHTGGSDVPIQVFTKAPNKRVSITRMGDSESYTAFDGAAGWLGSTGRPARDMSPAESQAAGLDAEFYLATRLKEIFPQLRRGRPEQIGGVECQVLMAGGQVPLQVRFYFDSQSGLLVRTVRYSETSMGRMPTQIDYADYREVDGVKIPFRWTLSRPNGRFTIQIADVKTNVAVDDAKFAKPAAEVK